MPPDDPKEPNHGNQGEGQAAGPPNPWEVFNDFSKTILTVASAVLGLTATFAVQILGTSPSRLVEFFFFTSWLGLVVSIVAALLAQGNLSLFLRCTPGKEGALKASTGALDCASASLWAFGIAVILLTVAAYLRFYFEPEPDASAAWDRTIKYLQTIDTTPKHQFAFEASNLKGDLFEIDVQDSRPVVNGSSADIVKYHVVISKAGDIISCEKS